jgi:hypothetical protein
MILFEPIISVKKTYRVVSLCYCQQRAYCSRRIASIVVRAIQPDVSHACRINPILRKSICDHKVVSVLNAAHAAQ